MILDDLYNGSLYPAEQAVPRNPRYAELSRNISAQMDGLQKELTKEQAQLVEQMREAMYEQFALDLRETFEIGFVLGTKLMQEVNDSPYASK